jgi:hypothetical protein
MTETVKLLNVKGREQLIEKFYFYDGEVPIVGGVVEIPLDHPEWVQRAWIMGYNRDPISEETLTLAEALSGEAVQPAEISDSAESTGEDDDEGSDGGGLPADTDGVRESEPQSDDSVSEPEVGSSDGNDATEDSGGDDTTD